MQIPVSQFLVRFMERLGIRHIFGMPGAHILPVYDALYDSSIQSVLAKHEQGAAFMAGGYARASGRIGACIATAGPGATNLVTGIANAHAEGLPVLAITGETSTSIFGRGGLQESSGEGGAIDQVGLFSGITRYVRRVERTDYLVNVLIRAARILLSESPGPVLLSFPFNLQQELIEEKLLDQVATLPFRHAVGVDPAAVDLLYTHLMAARHPAIVAGHGCIRAGAQKLVDRLSRALSIPVATSLKAKGVIDERSPLALGSLGVTSSGHAYRYLREKADLVLFLGAAFNERTSYTWNEELLQDKVLLQVDRNPLQLEKVFRADLALAGDIALVLRSLLERVEEEQPSRAGLDKREEEPAAGREEATTRFLPGFGLVKAFFERLAERFSDSLLLFDDNIIFAQNFFPASPGRRYFPNTGISSLGHAVPAAIGARFAEQGPAFAVLGDGGFQMCGMELMTAVNYGIPLNVVLFNNGTMGLIRKNQYQQYGQRYIDCDFVNPDYSLLAQSFGVRHLRVEKAADLDSLFSELDLEQGTNLIELPIHRDAFPRYTTRR